MSVQSKLQTLSEGGRPTALEEVANVRVVVDRLGDDVDQACVGRKDALSVTG